MGTFVAFRCNLSRPRLGEVARGLRPRVDQTPPGGAAASEAMRQPGRAAFRRFPPTFCPDAYPARLELDQPTPILRSCYGGVVRHGYAPGQFPEQPR